MIFAHVDSTATFVQHGASDTGSFLLEIGFSGNLNGNDTIIFGSNEI